MEGYYFGPYCCLGTDSRIRKDFNLVVQKAKGEGFSYVVKYTLLPGVSYPIRIIIGWNTRKVSYAQAAEEFKNSAETLKLLQAYRQSRGSEYFVVAQTQGETEIIPLNEFEGYKSLN